MDPDDDEGGIPSTSKPQTSRGVLWHRRKIIVVICVACALIATGLWLHRPLYLYHKLSIDAETGYRCTHLDQLARSGLVGRTLARSYVAGEFTSAPWYGIGFALQQQQLWLGMNRARLAGYFGVPSAENGNRDIWYTHRERLIQRLRISSSPPEWEDKWHEWNMCMVAEYNADDRLARLSQSSWPGDVVIYCDPSLVPFQRNVDIARTDSIPPEPAEWIEARAKNPNIAVSMTGSRDADAQAEIGSVSFRISEVVFEKTEDGEILTCVATRKKDGEKCEFGIEVHLRPPSGHSLFSSGKGAFTRRLGSASGLFLKDLAEAIEASSAISPEAVPRTDRLEFDLAILGVSQSKHPGGGFVDDPDGEWITTKIFLGLGDDEGQVYLNLNPGKSVGEFSIKDPEYGDIVVSELAKVF
ncbi:MAG: hypothetical protein JW889_14100 [Verrucomicrobia bacterium]|nr:hypothetical protein [Verrucomicrobiota bacterium]